MLAWHYLLQQVSEELIRVAILWHELWHEGLEEASRLYFGDRNVKGMFETLEPLHQMLERGPQTLKEISFQHVRILKSWSMDMTTPNSYNYITKCERLLDQYYVKNCHPLIMNGNIEL